MKGQPRPRIQYYVHYLYPDSGRRCWVIEEDSKWVMYQYCWEKKTGVRLKDDFYRNFTPV